MLGHKVGLEIIARTDFIGKVKKRKNQLETRVNVVYS